MFSIDTFIQRAIEEDIGDGDHTSLATIPAEATGEARLLVKQAGIIAGVEIAREIFKRFDPNAVIEVLLADGSSVQPGDIAFYVKARVHALLGAERLVLNIIQRMSGIATHTSRLVKKISHTQARLLDTRKTTPLFRYFEKEAVRIGGGYNHRMGLYDMIMIKDNHVDFAGGIAQAIHRVQQYLTKTGRDLKIEIEVRNIEELNQVLACGGVHRIMLDNFSPEILKQAVGQIAGRFETEASGGIDEHNIVQYAETGVDFISVGALTHQVQSLDLSLKAVMYK
ncbi:MAG: carboxylating nicotinate-nucleotide diphosphorylase [Flavobacteriales bacterium]|nr:carboxylating nicotinate-nucleotide diphosphorylase [Flavobacteriales bacterium]